MKARRSVLIQLLALGLAIGMATVAWPLFRGSVHPADEAPLIESLLPLTLMFGLFAATFGVIRGRNTPAVGIFRALTLSAGIFAAEQGILLGAALGRGAFTFRLLLSIVFGIFVGFAPILSRVEPNPWFGVRTPWTMGSRRVWRETHRLTGKLWFVGGLIGSAITMFGAPFFVVFAVLLVVALTPIPISYAAWRKLGRP